MSSVRLSICDVGGLWSHIGWNSSKIISRLVRVGRSLSADPNINHGSTPRGATGNFGPKWPPPCWFERRGYSIANCGRMVIAQWLQWRAYRKPPSLFRMVPSLTLYDLPFPQLYASLWHSFQWGSALQWATPNKQIDFPRSRRKINNRSLLHLSRGICCQLTSKAAVDFLIYRKSYLFNE